MEMGPRNVSTKQGRGRDRDSNGGYRGVEDSDDQDNGGWANQEVRTANEKGLIAPRGLHTYEQASRHPLAHLSISQSLHC